MSQDDKQFFIQLFNDQEKKFNQRFDLIDTKFEIIDARLEGVDARLEGVDGKFENIHSRFDRLEEKVQQNGLMIETLQDLISSVAENTTGLFRRVDVIESHLGLQ